jgi:hypothetical protein
MSNKSKARKGPRLRPKQRMRFEVPRLLWPAARHYISWLDKYLTDSYRARAWLEAQGLARPPPPATCLRGFLGGGWRRFALSLTALVDLGRRRGLRKRGLALRTPQASPAPRAARPAARVRRRFGLQHSLRFSGDLTVLCLPRGATFSLTLSDTRSGRAQFFRLGLRAAIAAAPKPDDRPRSVKSSARRARRLFETARQPAE